MKSYYKLIQLFDRQKAEPSDVILWIQGDRYDRGNKALFLFKKAFAPRIVLTGNNMLVGEKTAPGTNNITLKEMSLWLQKRGVAKNKIITESQSFNTVEQAKNIIALAKKNKWKKMLLVASFYHQPRVFISFLKSADEQGWKGKIINQPTKINWSKKPSGRKQSAKILAVEEINKIKKYGLKKILNKAVTLFGKYD